MEHRSGAIKVGLLIKEGGNVKSYKLRYIILKKDELSYWENDKATKPLGILNLKGCDVMAEKKGGKPGKGKKAAPASIHYHFLLSCTEARIDKKDGHGGKYRFVCDDKALCMSWVTAIEKAANIIRKKTTMLGAGLGAGLGGMGALTGALGNC